MDHITLSYLFMAILQYWYLAMNTTICIILTTYLLFHQYLRYLMIIYIIWMYVDDRKGQTGKRLSKAFRNRIMWHALRNYYPVTLRKLSDFDLDPGKNYLFCVYPHGVIAIGAFCAFATNACNVDEMFPSHITRLITLVPHFRIPFHREGAIHLGMISSEFDVIEENLREPKGGNVAVLVPGGASEAYYSEPGRYKIVLRSRTGFIKLALTTGAPLVPVFSFGETDSYYQSKGEKLRKAQKFVQNLTGLAPILTVGENGFYSCIPRRKPIAVVVGEPIEVEKVENPTSVQIQKLHATFVKALRNLFEIQKHLYLTNPDDVFLEIV